jgi:hypothetical protein
MVPSFLSTYSALNELKQAFYSFILGGGQYGVFVLFEVMDFELKA